MILQMVRLSGVRKVYVTEHRLNRMKAELAKKFGADDVIFTDETELTKYPFPQGGVDRVLVTTPPDTIDLAIRVCKIGAIVSFSSISQRKTSMASFDSYLAHGRKLQIQSSNAFPALCFPVRMDLLKEGMVKVVPLITRRFFGEVAEKLNGYLQDCVCAAKAVMVARE